MNIHEPVKHLWHEMRADIKILPSSCKQCQRLESSQVTDQQLKTLEARQYIQRGKASFDITLFFTLFIG